MRGLRSTLVLLVVAIGLGAYIYFVERHRAPASEAAAEQLFSFEEEDIAALQLSGTSGTVTELRRVDGTWRVIAPIEADADETSVSSVTSSLTSLEIGRVLDEGPVDLEPFGLADPVLDVGFSLIEGDSNEHLLIGEQTPTGADRYAKLAGADRVFLIAGHLNTTFDKTTFDLRDKAILETSSNDPDGLRLVIGDDAMTLSKEGNDWRMTEPWNARADFSTIQGLVGRLTSGTMQSIESEHADDLGTYGLAEPGLTMTLTGGSASATLHLGDLAPDGTRYARDASRDVVFTVEASLGTDLDRGPSDYRRKDLFAFRPFNATRLEIAQANDAVSFEKTTATTEGEQDQWRRVQPAALDVDGTEMDDLLAKLSNLRAESWVASRDAAGLDDGEPMATIHAHFGEDETEERVTVWRSGEDTFAVHGDEPGAATIDTGAFDDALAVLETVQTEES